MSAGAPSAIDLQDSTPKEFGHTADAISAMVSVKLSPDRIGMRVGNVVSNIFFQRLDVDPELTGLTYDDILTASGRSSSVA